jgi:serine protease Do
MLKGGKKKEEMEERDRRVSSVKRQTWFIAVLLLSTLALSGCSVAALPLQGSVAAAAPATAAVPQIAPTTVVPSAAGNVGVLDALQGTLEQVYRQVDPSVVSVVVIENASTSSLSGTTQTPQTVLGSGFVWDKEGDIVTNNHVVDGAGQISVRFADGTIASAKVIGTDVNSDLAVLKVDLPADALKPVQLGDSTRVQVGQLAVAIGNPFGEEGTMTLGIVSALGRTLPVQSSTSSGLNYSIPDVIQTDAPINPGNSGGVLVNDQGQVIGVTAAIESAVQSSAGIGFAIPSLIVQKVVPALIKTGHYDHPYLGISGTSLVPDLAKAMNLPSDQRGALVVTVTTGGPADKAGLRGSSQQTQINGTSVPVGGDVIVAIDGQPVQEFDDLLSYLARNTEVGQKVTLTVLRDGQEVTVGVTLAARPQQQTAQSTSGTGSTVGADLGIVGMTLTPQIAQAMNLPSNLAGVLVETIQPGGPADQAGLRGSSNAVTLDGQQLKIGGDIILGVDGIPVPSLDDLNTLLQQAQPGLTVTLRVLRDGQLGQVDVTLGQPTASIEG